MSPLTPPALKSLHAELAWPISDGKGVIVAVIDSGVAESNAHFTIGKNLKAGTNLVLDGANSEGWTDVDSHGTAVAGIIAAQPVDGSGVVGLAPGAQILPVRVFKDREQNTAELGFGPNIDVVAQGIRFAVDNGARIINVSISDPTDNPALRSAVEYAEANRALIVASAGNVGTAKDSTPGLRYPAAYPTVIGVAATNMDYVVTDSFHGEQVDVAAPGMNALTAYFGGGDCNFAGDAASTSWATAYVSATAALVASAHLDESPAEWRYRLTVTAARPDPSHRDDVQGWGLIQPYEALTLIDDGTALGPESPAHPRVAPAPEPLAPLDLTTSEPPLLRTQEIALWAGVTGGAALIVLLLIARARRDRHTARTN